MERSARRDSDGTCTFDPVSDLAATEKFYTNVLDYEVVTRYGGQALFISTGKYHHHIGLNTWQSNNGKPSPANAVGLKSYTVAT